MAAKVAARMVADKHLDPSRRSVPLTANPQAAFNSSLFSYGSDFEKEDQLRAELPASIAQVLRFLQVSGAFHIMHVLPVLTNSHHLFRFPGLAWPVV